MPVRTLSLPVQGLDDHDSVAIDDIYVPNLRNVRSDRSRIVRSPGGTLLCPVPDPTCSGTSPGFGIRSGMFAMRSSTGTQTITHNLGVTPSALILYCSGATSLNTATKYYMWCTGMMDGTLARSSAITSINSDPSTTARSYRGNAIHLIDSSGTVVMGGLFDSWTDTTFTLDFNISDSSRYLIGWAILGNAAMSAKLVQWTYGTSTGNQSVTGVGFEPQVVLHLHSSITGSLGSATNAQYAIGGMDASGGQFASSWISQSGQSGHNVGEGTEATSAVTMIDQTGSGFIYKATYVSMDVDGFTVNRVVAPAAGRFIASLCLDGFSDFKVGRFPGQTVNAPNQSHFTGIGFKPSGMIQAFTNPNGFNFATDGGNMGIGSADGGSQTSAAVTEGSGSTSGALGNQSRSTALFLDTSDGDDPGGTNDLWTLFSFDSDGFTLQVVKRNDLVPLILFGLVFAFETSVDNEVGVIRNYADLIVGGVVPTESIVMLTSKSAFTYTPVTPSTGLWTCSTEVYTGTDIQRFSIANGTDATYGAVAAWSQGADNIRAWDGTAFAPLITAGTNVAARVVLAFNNRIVAVRPFLGGVDLKTQIRWSVNGDFADWSGTGSGTLEVVETSNQALTGGIVLGSRCYLTRAREVIELIATGSLSPVFIPEVRVSGVGCIATHSMAAGDIYAFWLGPDEIYQWDGSQLLAVGGKTYNTITQLVDYETLDQIQGVVYTPDSQYWLVVPPYIFIYDYRRQIWDWDDIRSFQAIGILSVQDLITADLNHSEFVVIGDSSVQTIREDPEVDTYLGAAIDSYFETKDFLPVTLVGRAYEVAYDKYNTVWRIWFRGTPGELIEVAISTNKGLTYPYMQVVTVNAQGVGIFFSDVSWGVLRIRFRSQGGSEFSIQGPINLEFTDAGVMLPP